MRQSMAGVTRDHPREYGENILRNLQTLSKSGPSPRIRGELSSLNVSFVYNGTIPANTGRILGRV